ncbi:MAG: phospho-N-acetylmuramoyl-pentapeptide-transferase, partial [Bifidobacteriaceae bacterium]|nr:phospho-N-acetylmuramoyl-pentapeptide-transferase [Bifidobacteriaceae bacterium]
MISLILAAIVSFGTTLFVTPHFIKYLTRKKYGQFIRQDGPERHFDKLGTPTMGGVVIIFAVILGFVTYSAYNYITINHPPSTSLLLVLFLFLSMGLVGFIDDYIQIVKKRSLGLTVKGKLALQLLFGSVFTVLAINFPNSNGLTPASTNISFLRDTSLNFEALGPVLGVIALIIWINFIILSWTNAINLTDGLDGLATGVSSMGFAAYVLICMWKSSKSCALAINQGITTTNISDITGEATTNELCYTVRDPWDLATFSAIVLVALVGFLWWNASPAKIFMGDTGSLALGGA